MASVLPNWSISDGIRSSSAQGRCMSDGCRLMGIARSTFYDMPDAAADDATIVAQMKTICDEFETYGYRRVGAELRHRGIAVNAKKVRRLMRAHALNPKRRKRFIATTDSDHNYPIYPNLATNMTLEGPNQLWVADITYVVITTSFVYLAVILDAWSRRVVGYAVSRSIDARLAAAALKAAINARNPPRGCVHHSDRGSQYASEIYRAILRDYGFVGSMSRRGNPYDNAKAESFMKTLKVEAVYLMAYETLDEVAADLPRFINEIYNSRRLHSALGYMSPVQYDPNGQGSVTCLAFRRTDPAFEPSLYQGQLPPSGNAIFRGRDKDLETVPAIQSADCRDKIRAQIAAGSGRFALNREIPVCSGLRGGAGRCPMLGWIKYLRKVRVETDALKRNKDFASTRTPLCPVRNEGVAGSNPATPDQLSSHE